MHKEIVVNVTPNEVRVGLMEDHQLVEVLVERADARRIVGNVYRGVVSAVRPGLQAAFVDIGMEKAGFLHVSDLIHDDSGEQEDAPASRGRRGPRGGSPRRTRGRGRENLRSIETMLREGDEILVQVTKEVIGTKGPRLTADLSLPGRFLVMMPKGSHVGVSRKIEDRHERVRLRDMLSKLKPDGPGAYIIRTAGVGVTEKMLARDVEYLAGLWENMQEASQQQSAPSLVHEDVGLIVGLVRDILKEDVNALHIDEKDEYERLMRYIKHFAPDLKSRVQLYRGDVAIFDKFGIESELKKSLDKKVWLNRGGVLVIEQTEALVAIDVNTGRYTGKRNQEETILRTNMMAAREIPRQLRLRDIGGIIVIDFIDMENESDKRKVLAELRTHLRHDRARTKTFAVSDLGLVEMSRQRVRQSVKDILSDDCPYCRGTGKVLSIETLSNKVERMLEKVPLICKDKALQVQAGPQLALELQLSRGEAIEEIAREAGLRINIVDDPRLHREEFRIVALQSRRDIVSDLEDSKKSSRGERGARPERGERSDRSERSDRGERSERGGRRGRRSRGERSAQGSSEQRGEERNERGGRPERAERPDRGERQDRGERSERPERSSRRRRGSGSSDERPTPAEQPARSNPLDRLDSSDGTASDAAPTRRSDGGDAPTRRRRRRGGRRRRRSGDDATAPNEQRQDENRQDENQTAERAPRRETAEAAAESPRSAPEPEKAPEESSEARGSLRDADRPAPRRRSRRRRGERSASSGSEAGSPSEREPESTPRSAAQSAPATATPPQTPSSAPEERSAPAEKAGENSPGTAARRPRRRARRTRRGGGGGKSSGSSDSGEGETGLSTAIAAEAED